jgi:hypothetical protein
VYKAQAKCVGVRRGTCLYSACSAAVSQPGQVQRLVMRPIATAPLGPRGRGGASASKTGERSCSSWVGPRIKPRQARRVLVEGVGSSRVAFRRAGRSRSSPIASGAGRDAAAADQRTARCCGGSSQRPARKTSDHEEREPHQGSRGRRALRSPAKATAWKTCNHRATRDETSA